MSPLSTFDKFRSSSKSKGIFERLQADTELRLRARLNSVSATRVVYAKASVPIEDKLIRKGKEREIRLRHLIEQEELKRIQDLQDRPYVSPNSKAILNGKHLNNSKISGSTKKLAESTEKNQENNKQENFKENKTLDPVNPASNLQDFRKNPENPLKTYQKQLIKQLEHSYKLLCEKKKPKDLPFEVKCSDRRYVPSFAKQGEWKTLIPKSSSLNTSSNFSKTSANLTKKMIRPDSRLVAESGVGFDAALTYQQMIRNRIVNFSQSFNTLGKGESRRS
jgi:hypothetical protein